MSLDSPYAHCNLQHCDRYAKLHGRCLLHALHDFSSLIPRPPSMQSIPTWPAEKTMTPPPPSSSSSLIDHHHHQRETVIRAAVKSTKKYKCRVQGCLSLSRGAGLCTRHGGGRKCGIESCTTAAQTGGFCRLHGGGSRCRLEQCQEFARIRGLCLRHFRLDTTTRMSDEG
jgi:hypothetical protein